MIKQLDYFFLMFVQPPPKYTYYQELKLYKLHSVDMETRQVKSRSYISSIMAYIRIFQVSFCGIVKIIILIQGNWLVQKILIRFLFARQTSRQFFIYLNLFFILGLFLFRNWKRQQSEFFHNILCLFGSYHQQISKIRAKKSCSTFQLKNFLRNILYYFYQHVLKQNYCICFCNISRQQELNNIRKYQIYLFDALLWFQRFKQYNKITIIMEIKKAQSVQTDTSITIEEFDYYLQLTCKLFTDLLEQQQGECNSIFNCESSPSTELCDYIRNIHTFTNFSQQCLLVAIIYMDRYNLKIEDFCLNSLNIHRIYLTCLLLATKFQDDIYYDNKSFQLAGGVSTQELLEYELQISTCLDFNLFVSVEEYKKLMHKLEDAYSTIE